MRIKEIIGEIEKIAPPDTAMDFDNTGLLVGGDDDDCTGVLLCVDVTTDALKEAEALGCNLIISHHPLIFTPKRAILFADYQSRIIVEAFSKRISVYAAHTNVDGMVNNMSVEIFGRLGAKKIATFVSGYGAIGEITPIPLKELCKKLSEVTGDNRIFSSGDENKIIGKLAMINGAGADDESVLCAKELGADVFISAEIKHHLIIWARENGLALINIGHYASEKCFNDIISDILKCHFDTLKIVKYYEGNL